MSKIIKLKDNRSVTIVTSDSPSYKIPVNEIEMDIRVKEAVKSAIHRAKTCKKPIARYDSVSQKAYIETEDGRRIYVG